LLNVNTTAEEKKTMNRTAMVGAVAMVGALAVGTARAEGVLRQSYNIEVQAVVAPESVRQALPYYDEALRQVGLEGSVVMKGTIDTNGRVSGIEQVSGHPLLGKAAREAVQRWRYKPAKLNDKPVALDLTVTVDFSLKPQVRDGAKSAEPSVAVVTVYTLKSAKS
jgi:protein TonB